LGQNLSFTPESSQSSIAGFIGMDITHHISANTILFGGAEFAMGTDTTLRADARGGIKVSF
jgi:hypothetical protein